MCGISVFVYTRAFGVGGYLQRVWDLSSDKNVGKLRYTIIMFCLHGELDIDRRAVKFYCTLGPLMTTENS